jgi:hypothetical protein
MQWLPDTGKNEELATCFYSLPYSSHANVPHLIAASYETLYIYRSTQWLSSI